MCPCAEHAAAPITEKLVSVTEASCKAAAELNTDTIQLALISENHKMLNVLTDTVGPFEPTEAPVVLALMALQ